MDLYNDNNDEDTRIMLIEETDEDEFEDDEDIEEEEWDEDEDLYDDDEDEDFEDEDNEWEEDEEGDDAFDGMSGRRGVEDGEAGAVEELDEGAGGGLAVVGDRDGEGAGEGGEGFEEADDVAVDVSDDGAKGDGVGIHGIFLAWVMLRG